jgi:hypothetical protein
MNFSFFLLERDRTKSQPTASPRSGKAFTQLLGSLAASPNARGKQTISASKYFYFYPESVVISPSVR